MAQRCVNCYISSHRNKRFSLGSESEKLKQLIQSWIAPHSLSYEDVLCHECWLLGIKALESNNHTRCFGHVSVCIGCGKSTTNHSGVKRSRHYKLLVDGVPNATYFQLISEWIAPKQIMDSSTVCYACCEKAKRWVARKKVPPKLSINNLCRVCLRQNDDMLCIFDENHRIQHKIEFCTGIQLTNDSDTPTKICISCNNDLSTAFVFKTNFYKSNDKLSSLLDNKATKRKFVLTPHSQSTEKKIKKEFEAELKFAEVPVPFDYNEEALTIPIQNTDGDVKHEVVVVEENNVTSDTNIDDYSFNVDFDYLDSAYSNRCGDHEEEIKEQKQRPAKCSKSSNLPRLVLKTCETCCEEFTTYAEYKRHLPKHFKNKFECEQCNEIFPSYASRKNHILKHSGIGYNCDQCSYKTHNKVNLKHHINKKHKNLKHHKPTCHVCRAVFPSNKQRDEHFNEEHLYKRWFCELCKRTLYEEKEDHMLLHSEPQFECHDCGHKYYTKENIQAHIMKIHLGMNIAEKVEPKVPKPRRIHTKREWPCEVCGTKFNSWHVMMTHQKEHNAGYWICPICGLTGKTCMRSHMSQHKTEDLECDYCGHLFANKKYLVNHIKRHMRKTGFQCELCSKILTTKHGLGIHRRNIHLKQKNYQCPECGVWKFNKQKLKNHMFKHNGVKDWKCDLCDSAFARLTYLKNHLQKDHGVTVPNCSTAKKRFNESSVDIIKNYLISIGRIKS